MMLSHKDVNKMLLSLPCDTLKMSYINKLLDSLDGTQVVFVQSPLWYGQDSALLEPIKHLLKHRNVLFLDFANDIKYVHNNNFFHDGKHLNFRGSTEFTKDLIRKLKEYRLVS
jgi:poly-D-alanine transfer protein DltD